MSILKQFMESSNAVTQEIEMLMLINQRLEQQVAKISKESSENIARLGRENIRLTSELEAFKDQAKPAQEPKKSICELMQVGEVYCGLRVGAAPGELSETPIYFESGDCGQWVNEPVARAVYNTEIELSHLRRIVNEYKSEAKKSEQK